LEKLTLLKLVGFSLIISPHETFGEGVSRALQTEPLPILWFYFNIPLNDPRTAACWQCHVSSGGNNGNNCGKLQ